MTDHQPRTIYEWFHFGRQSLRWIADRHELTIEQVCAALDRARCDYSADPDAVVAGAEPAQLSLPGLEP